MNNNNYCYNLSLKALVTLIFYILPSSFLAEVQDSLHN